MILSLAKTRIRGIVSSHQIRIRSRNHGYGRDTAVARASNMKQRAKQRWRYANATLNSVTNQRDRLISEEPELHPAFLPPVFILASWNPLDVFLPFSVSIFFSLSRSRQPFAIGFIPPSALSRKASRFDALNRPFHWQSGYYETSSKILSEDIFEITV